MATDLSLKLFSLHFFDVTYPLSDSLLPAGLTEFCNSESLTKIDLGEVFDLRLVQATLTVKYFYGYIFENIINNDKTKHPKSKEEFCSYVRCTYKSENWFSKLTIFERCFATVSFALTCSEYFEKAIGDVQINAHVTWIQYFTEYMEEFYKAGGWTELRRVANSYARVDDFIGILNPAPDILAFLDESSKSVENYMHFRFLREDISEEKTQSKFFEELEIKYGNKHKSAASSWIKFIVQNGNVQSFDTFFVEYPREPLEVTHLFRVLRNFCDPNFSEGEESLSTIIKNVPRQNTAEEKECEDKNSDLESITRGEDDVTKNAPLVSLVAGKELKSNEWKTVPKKERSEVSDEKVNFGEEVSSSSIFSKVALQNTAEEKKCDEKDNIESITKGEDDVTKNAPLVSLVAGKVLQKSNEWKTVLKKGRSRVSVENNFGEAISSSSIFFYNSLQNAAIEELCKDSGNENSIGCENDGMHNVSCTSSIASEMVDISNVQKKNRKKNRKRNRKKGLKVSNKSFEHGDAIRQATSNSISNHGSLQNTTFEKERDGISIEDLVDENDGIKNVLYTSSMDTEVLKKSDEVKTSGKKAGLQVSDKNLEHSEATRKVPTNSISVSLQNAEVEKERENKCSRENVAGCVNVWKSKVNNTCVMN